MRRNYEPENNSTALLLSYYDQHYQSFTGHLKESQRRFSKSFIHELRLGIKDLRSVYHFLDQLYPDHINENESYSILTKLFHITGMVREEQVNLSILRKYKSSLFADKIREYLTARKKSAYRKLHQFINKLDFNMIELINRRTIERIEGVKQDEIPNFSKLFIQQGFRRIKKFTKVLTDTNLHEIRKELKAIINIMGFQQLIGLKENPERMVSAIRTTEAQIGDWHNRLIFQIALKEIRKKELSESYNKGIKKLVVMAGRQKEKKRGKIVKELKNLNRLINKY